MRDASQQENRSGYNLPNFQASESEVGEIAVARRDARGGCEQAVDRGHQAAENSGRRSEGGCSGLGHLGPLF